MVRSTDRRCLVNIPSSAIRPFEPLGIPSIGMWNESANKWLTTREFWDYVFKCLDVYAKHLSIAEPHLLNPDDVERIVSSVIKNLGVDIAMCRHHFWNTSRNNQYTVMVQYLGEWRHENITLPNRIILP